MPGNPIATLEGYTFQYACCGHLCLEAFHEGKLISFSVEPPRGQDFKIETTEDTRSYQAKDRKRLSEKDIREMARENICLVHSEKLENEPSVILWCEKHGTSRIKLAKKDVYYKMSGVLVDLLQLNLNTPERASLCNDFLTALKSWGGTAITGEFLKEFLQDYKQRFGDKQTMRPALTAIIPIYKPKPLEAIIIPKMKGANEEI